MTLKLKAWFHKKILENMGILERAKIVARKMKFSEQSDLYFRVKRLLSLILWVSYLK